MVMHGHAWSCMVMSWSCMVMHGGIGHGCRGFRSSMRQRGCSSAMPMARIPYQSQTADSSSLASQRTSSDSPMVTRARTWQRQNCAGLGGLICRAQVRTGSCPLPLAKRSPRVPCFMASSSHSSVQAFCILSSSAAL